MRGHSTARIAAALRCIILVAVGCAAPNGAPLCPPGSLLAACRESCESDGDCLAPARCDPGTHTCQRPASACDPLVGQGSSPTGSDGNGCASSQECDLVTATCAPRPGAMCQMEFDCRAGEICDGSACVPAGSSAQCKRDGDCTTSNVCRLIFDAAGKKLVSLCGPPIGPAEAGARCRENRECQSGLCLRSGVCFGGCELESETSTRDDCHSHDSVICGQTVLSLNAEASMPMHFMITSCVLLPPACQSDRDCDASGGACQIFVDPKKPTQLRTGCLPARGARRASEACQSDGDCASGLCTGTPRTCFAACRSIGDCRAMAALVCRPTVYQLDGISGSIASCVTGP